MSSNHSNAAAFITSMVDRGVFSDNHYIVTQGTNCLQCWIELEPSDSWHGLSCAELTEQIDLVFGVTSITFSQPGAKSTWWIGFDYIHDTEAYPTKTALNMALGATQHVCRQARWA